jgi:hypothetical protein
LLVDEGGSARKLEALSGGVGFSAFMGGVRGEPQSLLEFAPAILPRFLPTKSAFFLRKTADLVLLLRFHPYGKREQERPQIALYGAPNPPKLPAMWGRLGAGELNLQPGKKATLTDTWELATGAHLLQLVPRLHAACVEVKATATLPNGKTVSLLHIAHWDANWHRPFVFKAPLELPPKTRITLECRFDNTPESAYSRRQTRPHIIMPGLECMEEMASLWVLLTPQTAADSEALAQSAKREGSKPLITETGTYLRAPRN